MTLTTLVTGVSATARETAISRLLNHAESTALILEGLPDGDDRFGNIAKVQVFRIAPGCVCCIGNLTLRVTLNRILRHAPARIFISLASAAHLQEIHRFLTSPPYDQYLELTEHLTI